MGKHTGQASGELSTPLITVAVVILFFFAGLLIYMYRIAPTMEEALWNRALALFGSVEAIAFTAAGYLFGREVHREQAKKAENRADIKTLEAQQALALAAEEKHRGQGLAEAIKAKKSATSERTDGSLRGQPEGVASTHLDELATLAERLYPSRG